MRRESEMCSNMRTLAQDEIDGFEFVLRYLNVKVYSFCKVDRYSPKL